MAIFLKKMKIFEIFFEKNVKFWAIFLTFKWQFYGGSVSHSILWIAYYYDPIISIR